MLSLTGLNFKIEVEEAETPVLIEFYSERCAPCRALSAVLEALASEYSDRCKFCKVDVDVQEGLTQQFDILRIPTLVYLHDGEIIQRISGLRSREEILEILNLN
ncbi:MAG: thioredoxin family protein [Faecousia sp.]